MPSSSQTSQSGRIIRSLQAQLGLLVAQFLVGMALNLIGSAEEATSELQRISSHIALGLHIVIALGLAGGAIGLGLRLRGSQPSERRWGTLGGICTAIAFVAGIMTFSPLWPEVWSYFMAVAFLASGVAYGRLWAELKQS